MAVALTVIQRRVLGALAEKAATVPDTYPMTLNGLRGACNQKSSRDPVTDYDEGTILRTLDELKAAGLVRFVYASHGARTTKYRHVLDEQLGLDPGELALVTVLLLRGPQTINELRVRTERAHAFASNEAVQHTLLSLAARDEPLVRELARRPGQKETRWIHLLADEDAGEGIHEDVEEGLDADLEEGLDEWGREAAGPLTPDRPATPPPPTVHRDGDDLAARVAALEARVAALEAAFAEPTTAPRDHEEPTG